MSDHTLTLAELREEVFDMLWARHQELLRSGANPRAQRMAYDMCAALRNVKRWRAWRQLRKTYTSPEEVETLNAVEEMLKKHRKPRE